jgi:hypothetical protein
MWGITSGIRAMVDQTTRLVSDKSTSVGFFRLEIAY